MYNIEVQIIYNNDLFTATQYLEDRYDCSIPSRQNVDAITCFLPDGEIVICTSTLDKYIILHECTHVVLEIQSILGLEGQESICYMLEWLYPNVLKTLGIND